MSDTSPPEDSPTSAAKRSPLARLRSKGVLSLAIAVVAAVMGVAYILSPKSKVSTDNAYLRADSSVVAPKVRGHVADVLVEHNQTVRRGDALVRIDAEEFDAKVAAAEAELLDAEASVAAVDAELVALDAEEKLAVSSIHAAQSSVRAADAERERALADADRYSHLVGTGAVSRFDADRYRTLALSTAAEADRNRAQLDVSRNQAAVTSSKRLSLRASRSQADASVARARAALSLAKQDQAHTLITAPIAGVVADRQIDRGDFVQPGTRLLTIVPLDRLYVIANFKETQTDRMMTGQAAEIEIDALPGVTLHGTVQSFAPGAGSQFSLIPFEPGTGNFTKIVQRVPVRILFDPNQLQLSALRPGLSTTVTVRLNSDNVSTPRAGPSTPIRKAQL
jgi:membrane fusion protein, multidrug efflux system